MGAAERPGCLVCTADGAAHLEEAAWAWSTAALQQHSALRAMATGLHMCVRCWQQSFNQAHCTPPVNRLWASYQQQTAASALERGGLTVEGVASLPTEGSLEERLKALRPDSWQQEFCGGAGGKGGGKGAGGERPPGSPSLLLVSPSAIGAVNLIKLCPQFNKVRAAAALLVPAVRLL